MKLININHYKISYTGRRQTNEDSVLIEIEKKDEHRQVVIAAADGMGGYQNGEIASKMMIDQLQRLSRQTLSPDPKVTAEIVREHITKANRDIFAKTEQMDNIQMGTTVSGAVVVNDRCLFFNVGDSRTYLINSKNIEQVTRDHTVDGDQLRNGIIDESNVGKGQYSDALTRSVGTDAEVEVDIFPNQGFYQLGEGELILCCTDGLWKALTKQEIYREFFLKKNLAQSLKALVSLAYSKGSNDNISLAALEYGKLKRKKEKLRYFVPMSKFIKKTKGNTVRKLIFLLMAIFVILFAAIMAIVIIKLSNPGPPVVQDNQIKKIPSTGITISSRDHPIEAEVDNNIEVHGGKIIFKPGGNTYSGRVKVQLVHENLKSSEGEIPSVIYYTTNGSEPAKDNGLKYISGKKIVFSRPGEYIVKARLIAGMGKYQGEIYSEKYVIKSIEPKVITVENIDQLDIETKNDILGKTKRIKFPCSGVLELKRSGEIKILLSISSNGDAEMLDISGMDVKPKNKLVELKDALTDVIRKQKFLPPTFLGKPANVKIYITFNRTGSLGPEIVLDNYKDENF